MQNKIKVNFEGRTNEEMYVKRDLFAIPLNIKDTKEQKFAMTIVQLPNMLKL